MRLNFRLNSILNIKVQTEDILKTKLAESLAQLDFENKKLDLLIAEWASYSDEYKNMLKKSAQIIELSKYTMYFSKQKEKIKAQKENVHNAREHVDKTREELIKVAQEKEMLEKLKKKQVKIFNKMQIVEEQKIIDEIVCYKHNGQSVEVI